MDAKDFTAWRERMEFNRSEAADALGVGRNMPQKYESGAASIPRYIELACAALEARVERRLYIIELRVGAAWNSPVSVWATSPIAALGKVSLVADLASEIKLREMPAHAAIVLKHPMNGPGIMEHGKASVAAANLL